MTSTISVRLLVLGLSLLCLLLGLIVCASTFAHFLAQGFLAWDAPTYLAAGERLNAGHNLYSLVAGDRPVLLDPPYWTVPLLSPPPIAVVWRPLAALGSGSMLAWWLACIAAICATVAAVSIRAPRVAGPALLILSVPLAWELGSANVNGLFFAGFVGAWLLARAGHDRVAGVLVALMASVKVWPVLLIVWFAAQGRSKAVVAFAVGGLVIGVGSILFAGLGANLDYLGVGAAIKPSPGSIAGMLLSAGVDAPWIGYAIAAAAIMAILVLRRFPALTYALAIGAIVLASPALYLNSFALLFTALAPFVWRPSSRADNGGTIDLLRGRVAAGSVPN